VTRLEPKVSLIGKIHKQSHLWKSVSSMRTKIRGGGQAHVHDPRHQLQEVVQFGGIGHYTCVKQFSYERIRPMRLWGLPSANTASRIWFPLSVISGVDGSSFAMRSETPLLQDLHRE
jgi:hypothetical protein